MNSSSESNPMSIWPITLAAGLTLVVSGVVTSLFVSILGVALLIFALGGWAQESRIADLVEVEVEEEEERRHGRDF